jgi:MoxR-like ATPase
VTSGATGRDIARRLAANLAIVMQGQRLAIRRLLAAFASGGHVLLEDYPGTGKTTLAKALARSIGAQFKRIQFTPDLLPSDILGVSIYDQREQTFRFYEGPIFTSVLLADEINRASPRTQSALLEAMGEGQVTVDGTSYRLHDPFFVIATQNPVEFRGTYPLPEAQMDRFALQFGLGYVEPDEEVAILTAQARHHPLDDLRACATADDVAVLRAAARAVRVSDEIRRYVVDVVRATRVAPGVQLGASPRASLALLAAAQALALFDDQPFVNPEHVQEIAGPVIAHRLAIDPQARFAGLTGAAVVHEVVKTVPVPA